MDWKAYHKNPPSAWFTFEKSASTSLSRLPCLDETGERVEVIMEEDIEVL